MPDTSEDCPSHALCFRPRLSGLPTLPHEASPAGGSDQQIIPLRLLTIITNLSTIALPTVYRLGG